MPMKPLRSMRAFTCSRVRFRGTSHSQRQSEWVAMGASAARSIRSQKPASFRWDTSARTPAASMARTSSKPKGLRPFFSPPAAG